MRQRQSSRVRPVAGLCVGVLFALVSACTTAGSAADRPQATSTYGPVARCRPGPSTDGGHLLRLHDVWGSDNGGISATTVDLAGCGGAPFDFDAFVCRLPFPWLTAERSAAQLTALGATRTWTGRLVSASAGTVTETVIDFGRGVDFGPRVLEKLTPRCGGSVSRSPDGATIWSSQGGSVLAVHTSPKMTVAVEFHDDGLTAGRRQVVLDLAVTKAARLAS